MIGVSLKYGGRKGGGRQKSCKGLSKQMPNGGAFVIKCSEDRGSPLLMFLDGEQGVKPSEDKSESAADSARVAQLEAALKEKEAELAKEKAENQAALAEKETELAKLREASTAQPRIKLRDEITKELGKISAMSPDIVKARKYLRRLEGAYAKRIETYASTNPARVARIEMEAAECRRQGDAIIKSMQAPAPDAK